MALIGILQDSVESVEFWRTLLILVVAGAFGGLLRGLQPSEGNAVRPCVRNGSGRLELGWVGDVLMGIGGALAIVLVGDTFGVFQATNGANPPGELRLLSLGLIAGFLGRALLTDVSERIARQVRKESVRAAEAVDQKIEAGLEKSATLSEADSLLGRKEYIRAERVYRKVDELDGGQDRRARRGVATCLAYRAMESQDLALLDEAEKILDALLNDQPNDADATYNRMWTRALRYGIEEETGASRTVGVDQIVVDLRHAIELDPDSRRWARVEPALRKLILDHQELHALTGDPPKTKSYCWQPGEGVYHSDPCAHAEMTPDWVHHKNPPAQLSPCPTCFPPAAE